jgi:hypothetical protein
MQATGHPFLTAERPPDSPACWQTLPAGSTTMRGRTGIDRMARGSDCVSWLVGRPRKKSTVLQLPKLSLLWLLN